MPPGLMSRRKSRHLVWGMGTGDWGLGTGGLGNGERGSRKVLPPEGERGQPIIPIAPPEPL